MGEKKFYASKILWNVFRCVPRNNNLFFFYYFIRTACAGIHFVLIVSYKIFIFIIFKFAIFPSRFIPLKESRRKYFTVAQPKTLHRVKSKGQHGHEQNRQNMFEGTLTVWLLIDKRFLFGNMFEASLQTGLPWNFTLSFIFLKNSTG